MLTPSAISNAKPKAKAYKLTDERGMFLLVQPSGSRLWRWKYRRPDTRKENLLSLGSYPEVSLKRAREKREEARALLADGVDPGAKRQSERIAGAETFEAVAREWFAKFSPKWATGHADKIIRRLERDVFPWIGTKPIAKVSAPDLLAILRRIEARNAIETAHRANQNCGQVFRYAVATGRANADVTRDLRGSLAPAESTHYASIVEPARVGELLRAIEGFTGSYVTAAALKLAPLVFARPGELRTMCWRDVDLDAGEWRYTASKTGTPHIVPLASQAVVVLRDLHPLTARSEYVFPGARNSKQPLSNMTLNAALRRMGYDKTAMTTHGFRAMARTILDEVLGFRPDYIEHQLAHAVRDPNGRSYNRTAHLAERRKMMQTWADYLDSLRDGKSKVTAIGRKTA